MIEFEDDSNAAAYMIQYCVRTSSTGGRFRWYGGGNGMLVLDIKRRYP